MTLNRICLIGRLTRDPEYRTTTTGKSVCDFSIAVAKKFKPQDGSPDADFFRVQCWGTTADFVSNYLGKGRLIAVDGRLQSRKYTDSNGNNRESIEVVADSVQGLDRHREDGQNETGQHKYGPGNGTAATARPTVQDEYDPFAEE